MVFVVLSGLPRDVDPEDLAYKINDVFGKNEEIGTFRVNIDESHIRKPKAVLKFKQGFDAMEAQRLLDTFVYRNPNDNMIYKVKAIVPANDRPYNSLFSEREPDIADVITAEKRKHKKNKKERKARKRKHSIEKKIHGEKSDGECSVESQRPVSPEESARKKTYCNFSTTATCSSTRSPNSIPERYSKKMREYHEYYKRAHTPADTAPAAPALHERSHNVDEMKYTRPAEPRRRHREERLGTERSGRERSNSRRPAEGLILKLEDRRQSLRESRPKERDYQSKAYLDSLYKGGRSRSERDRIRSMNSPKRDRVKSTYSLERDSLISSSTNESDCTALDILKPNVAKSMFTCIRVPEATHYLTEDDPLFQEAVATIIHTVARATERLNNEDRQLIIDNYTDILVHRVKNMKFTDLMSLQDIVLDYTIVYNTADDKLLIYRLVKELQAMGKGEMRPEIKQERLNNVLDEMSADIDQVLQDIKPDIKPDVKPATSECLPWGARAPGAAGTAADAAFECLPWGARAPGAAGPAADAAFECLPWGARAPGAAGPAADAARARALPRATHPDEVARVKVFVGKLKDTKPAKYFRPIRNLLNEMKLFIYKNATAVSSDVILNRMVEVLEKVLSRLLSRCPVAPRLKARAVCGLFRQAFPYSADRDFVDMIVRWIQDGEFESGIDGLITEKVPKIGKDRSPSDDNSTAKHNLPVPIKTEASDTDTIKTEKPNEHNNEETVATTKITIKKEHTTEDVVIKRETNVENVDVIINKEPVDVIMIDDDEIDNCFIVTKKEPVNDNMTSEVKLETVSESEDDEGAMSDDSRTTLVLDRKPDLHHIENDTAFGVNHEFTDIKNEGESDTPCMTELKTELD